ncbi:MAG: murein biosynthesis integral membrane protein MurJ, partial [Eggerthellaceae bacterium]|nr:murein biosynthesis integral membrane protein MurJ [Eggerthellaceae bacterium]
FELGKILWTVVRVVIASGVAVAVSFGLGAIIPEGIGMIDGIIRIVVSGGVALVVAFGLCIVLKVPYMNYVTDLVGKVAGKLKRS